MKKFILDTANGIILCKAKIASFDQSIFLKLAVDTGASITMIPAQAALGIGIDPSSASRHLEITTANGIILAPIVTIPSFICFGIKIRNMDVLCHNLPPESAVEGLLGLNFLKKAKIVIDFSNNVILAP